ERIIGVRDRDGRKLRERERWRRVAERLVVRDVELEPAFEPVRHLMRQLEITDVALLARHEAPELAEVELAEAERDIADRRALDHGAEARNDLRILRRDRRAVGIGEH